MIKKVIFSILLSTFSFIGEINAAPNPDLANTDTDCSKTEEALKQCHERIDPNVRYFRDPCLQKSLNNKMCHENAMAENAEERTAAECRQTRIACDDCKMRMKETQERNRQWEKDHPGEFIEGDYCRECVILQKKCIKSDSGD